MADGDVHDMAQMKIGGRRAILVAGNEEFIKVFQY
jgi:hypothetical protein